MMGPSGCCEKGQAREIAMYPPNVHELRSSLALPTDVRSIGNVGCLNATGVPDN